jgi:peptidoglycan hydrolase-like protein with peptidoglycan-binding domain
MQFTKSLFMYMRGEEVANMQMTLIGLNEEYNFSRRALGATGYFGFETVHFVRDFQNYFGLPPTGAYDAQTHNMAETKHYELLSKLKAPKAPAASLPPGMNNRKWW